ncbi:MAG: hypothetical protein QOE48_3646 [Mycobacterium sp.]|jgi:hypothetical protein|nr:hypothetical protein [Mycobacterium sp.]MDT5307968.1 hypothetical protein [Mycobacterium sp.]
MGRPWCSCRLPESARGGVSVCTVSDCLRGAGKSSELAPANTGRQQQCLIAASTKCRDFGSDFSERPLWDGLLGYCAEATRGASPLRFWLPAAALKPHDQQVGARYGGSAGCGTAERLNMVRIAKEND